MVQVSEIKGPRYKIDREIGRGAFGVVYLANDNVLRRRVALKVMVIPEGLTEDEQRHLVDRFYREARAAAGLTHTNIVTIHDISKARDKHFISMEYLEGEPLSRAIGSEPMDLTRATAIADGILAGLEYAHGHEVVHRDIKPDNIFLLEDGTVKLVDFGLARVQASTTITKSGSVMGSPGYIAPEVIDGKLADKRTDVFSFGVVLYEMLTGSRPFGPTDAFESFVRVIYRIMSEEPEPPSAKNGEVPHEFDVLLGKMLAKDPDDRFQDASEARRTLNELASDPGIHGTSLPTADVKQKTVPERTEGEASAATRTAVAAEAVTADDSEVWREREDASRTAILQLEEDMIAEGSAGRRRTLKVLAGVLAGLLVLGGLAVLILFVFGVFSGSDSTVPNVVNLDKEVAIQAIRKAGLKVGKVEDFFAYDIWKGKVSSQKPSAGTKVPKGSSVDIQVSIGSKVAEVPDVVGMPQDQAAATIVAFTFKPKMVAGYSDTVPAGCVISQQPAAKTIKASEEVVTLVINSGVKPVDEPTSDKQQPTLPKRSTPILPRRQ